MKLKAINIRNFRSIEDQTINFEQFSSLFFFGINESGKSNILKAIAQLDDEIVDPVLKFMPAKDIRKQRQKDPATLSSEITFHFTLGDFNEFFNKIIPSGFVNPLTVVPEGEIKLEYTITLLNDGSRAHTIDFTDYKEVNFSIRPNLKKLIQNHPTITEIIFNGENYHFNRELWFFQSEIIDQYNANPSAYTNYSVQDFFNKSEKLLITEFEENLPKIIYWKYDPKYLITEPIPVSAFIAKPSLNITFKNVFKLIGCNTDLLIASKINNALRDQSLIQDLEIELSLAATKHIMSVWPEYKNFNVNIRMDATNFHVTIQDSLKGNYYSMEARSDGFKRFVSLLLNLSVGRVAKDLRNNIILLDEPEESIHPSGVKHLRDELISMGEDNYVIAASHSIFMVDKTNLERHYIVEKIDEITQITKVTANNFVNEEVIYNALGTSIFEIMKPTNLLFEGEDDRQFFEILNIKASGFRIDLFNFSEIGLCNASGVTKIEKFLQFFNKGKVEFLVVVDDDPEGNKAIENIEQMSDIKPEIYSFKSTEHRKSTFTLEDFLPEDLMQQIVKKDLQVDIPVFDKTMGYLEQIKPILKRESVSEKEINVFKKRLPYNLTRYLKTVTSREQFELEFKDYLTFCTKLIGSSKLLKK